MILIVLCERSPVAAVNCQVLLKEHTEQEAKRARSCENNPLFPALSVPTFCELPSENNVDV